MLWHFGITIKQNELWGSLTTKVTTEWVTHKAKIQWAKYASGPSHDTAGQRKVFLYVVQNGTQIYSYDLFILEIIY